jgi:chromosome segregation ATPase
VDNPYERRVNTVDKWIGLVSAVVIIVMSIILILLAIQSSKITEIGEKTVALETSLSDTPQKLSALTDNVTRLETSLGKASDDLKAHKDQLGNIAANLNTTQTALTQFVKDFTAVSGDIKALDQRITKIEGILQDHFRQIDAKFARLNDSVAKLESIQENVMALDKRLSGFEKEIIPTITNIQQKVDELNNITQPTLP